VELVGAGLYPLSTHKLRPDFVGTSLEGGTRSLAFDQSRCGP